MGVSSAQTLPANVERTLPHSAVYINTYQNELLLFFLLLFLFRLVVVVFDVVYIFRDHLYHFLTNCI